MRDALVSWFLLLSLGSSLASAQQLTVDIAAPADGSVVEERPSVEGTVSSQDAEVWVVVHPLGNSEYYVQPRTTVRRDGNWKVMIYVGRPGTADGGKTFEIRAFANPAEPLIEGKILDHWPGGEAVSDVVEVSRKEE